MGYYQYFNYLRVQSWPLAGTGFLSLSRRAYNNREKSEGEK